MTTALPRFPRHPPGIARAILWGGLAVGTLDILDAILFWGLWKHVPPVRIFQSVAGGLLGRQAANAGGLATALLGAALHYSIALSIVAVYYLASRRASLLRSRPVLCGLLYGLGALRARE